LNDFDDLVKIGRENREKSDFSVKNHHGSEKTCFFKEQLSIISVTQTKTT